MEQVCSSCNLPIQDNFYFCPNCGKKLKEKPLSTSIGKQIVIYTISFIIPPSGFWYGFKYISQQGKNRKIIGILSIVITLISSIISVYLFKNFIDNINIELSKQMSIYNSLGY